MDFVKGVVHRYCFDAKPFNLNSPFYYELWHKCLQISLSFLSMIIYEVLVVVFEGIVHQYCFDAKPFNLTACFITKYDEKCYDYTLKMLDHGQQCTMMYELY